MIRPKAVRGSDFPAILVVNQDAAIRKGLRVVLSGAGYFVWEVGTLRDAVEIAEHVRFDVVFVDKRILNFSERATVNALRQAFPQVRFIMPGGFVKRAMALVVGVLGRRVALPLRAYTSGRLRPACVRCAPCASITQQELDRD